MTLALPWRLAVVWRLLQDTSQVSKVTITFTPAALLLTATYAPTVTSYYYMSGYLYPCIQRPTLTCQGEEVGR